MPLAEKSLIAEIRLLAARRTRLAKSVVRLGIGDDCAVLDIGSGQECLVTTDFSLEDVHFRREWHPPDSVGHRCLTRGLSDIAAMGGTPIAAFLSLALPGDLAQSWVRNFVRGLTRLAEKFDVALAGGDTAQSPNKILADIIVVGRVPKGKAILRSGARPGDRIYVTGALGGSAAAVMQMQKTNGQKLKQASYPRHFYPDPQVNVGLVLRRKNLATAMIDTSDGLSTDLAHICEESGVGADLSAANIPRARVGTPAGEVDLNLALHGGEDYELLFMARANKKIPPKIAGVPITEIGQIVRRTGMRISGADGKVRSLKPQGWEHLK
jgi:thiamine-monophosphate kinase